MDVVLGRAHQQTDSSLVLAVQRGEESAEFSDEYSAEYTSRLPTRPAMVNAIRTEGTLFQVDPYDFVDGQVVPASTRAAVVWSATAAGELTPGTDLPTFWRVECSARWISVEQPSGGVWQSSDWSGSAPDPYTGPARAVSGATGVTALLDGFYYLSQGGRDIGLDAVSLDGAMGGVGSAAALSVCMIGTFEEPDADPYLLMSMDVSGERVELWRSVDRVRLMVGGNYSGWMDCPGSSPNTLVGVALAVEPLSETDKQVSALASVWDSGSVVVSGFQGVFRLPGAIDTAVDLLTTCPVPVEVLDLAVWDSSAGAVDAVVPLLSAYMSLADADDVVYESGSWTLVSMYLALYSASANKSSIGYARTKYSSLSAMSTRS